MFNAKKLTNDQIATIQQWAADGDQLNDIQKKMESEMELKLTYMDVRFLMLDLEITIRDIAAEEAAKQAELDALNPIEHPVDADMAEMMEELSGIPEEPLDEAPPVTAQANPPATGASSVTVTVDAIAKPGLMATGRVTFSDGQAGDWYIDDRGLGIDPDNDDCAPTKSDIEAFQKELQRLMDSQ